MKEGQKVWAVIPTAGIGSRMGAEVPKQYLELHGKAVIEHTLAPFINNPAISRIVVAISEDDHYWPHQPSSGHPKVVKVTGGQERCHSVLNALHWLESEAMPQDWVLVHDAARPCLTVNELNSLIQSLEEDPVGGLLATPVRDTMKRGDIQRRVTQTVERRDLWHALTPQMFRFGLLRRALEDALAAGSLVTDEASAVEFLGLSPRLISGQASNIKITLPEDLKLAAFYLQGADDARSIN